MKPDDIQKELESAEYKDQWARHLFIRNSLLDCLSICNMNFSRDEQGFGKNFFMKVTDDFIQSVAGISSLAKDGIMNSCRRECRYLIELALKACNVSQKNPVSKYEDQLTIFEKLLKEDSIASVNDLNLYLFDDPVVADDFRTHYRRLYGELSAYTHATSKQLRERIELVKKGRYIGFEGTEELAALNKELEMIFSNVIVLLFHSIPEWIVGDYLVEPDGTTRSFHFNKSKFINAIDSRFDYKAERQPILEQLKKDRSSREAF